MFDAPLYNAAHDDGYVDSRVCFFKGANWRHPLGPQSDINRKGKYPAVQIAYPDAEAYARCAGL